MPRNTTIRDRHRQAISRHKPDCGICLAPIDYGLPHTDPQSFVVDHIIPLNRGGADALYNPDGTPQLQAAHKNCNRAKSDKMPEDLLPAARIFRTSLSW